MYANLRGKKSSRDYFKVALKIYKWRKWFHTLPWWFNLARSSYTKTWTKKMIFNGGPQPLWHQGLVSSRQFFHRLGVGWGWFGDDSSTLHLYALYFYFYYIRSTSNHQVLEPRGWRILLYNIESEVKVLVAQSCPTFFNPMDCSPPGSFVQRILQVRMLERVAISFSRASSWPRDQS